MTKAAPDLPLLQRRAVAPYLLQSENPQTIPILAEWIMEPDRSAMNIAVMRTEGEVLSGLDADEKAAYRAVLGRQDLTFALRIKDLVRTIERLGPGLFQLSAMRQLHSTNVVGVAVMAAFLVENLDGDAAGYLRPLLERSDPQVRKIGLLSLARLQGPSLARDFAAAMRDPSLVCREIAYQALTARFGSRYPREDTAAWQRWVDSGGSQSK